MEPITLQSGASKAVISPHLGMNCHSFQVEFDDTLFEVIDAGADFSRGQTRPTSEGIPILFPFPNRIRGGQFTWEGATYRIPVEEVIHDPLGNAIHGFCLDRPWRVTAQSRDAMTGTFQLSVDAPERLAMWPADFIVEVRYQLFEKTLRADIEIANPDTRTLPWGFGTHPYFRAPLGNGGTLHDCVIEAPVSDFWELADFIPTGVRQSVPHDWDLPNGFRLGNVGLDHVFTGLPIETDPLEMKLFDERAGLVVTQAASSGFREIVIYTPSGRNTVCMEPYTCITDAINRDAEGVDAGLQKLPPGSSTRLWIEIRVDRILV